MIDYSVHGPSVPPGIRRPVITLVIDGELRLVDRLLGAATLVKLEAQIVLVEVL